MEWWYLSEKGDDFIIPDNGELVEAGSMDDEESSQEDWCQWGVTGCNDVKSPNKYCGTYTVPSLEDFKFDRQSTCGQPSLMDCSTITSRASLRGYPDFKLQSTMEEMNDIFLDSFLEEEIFPDSIYESPPVEGLRSNIAVDPEVFTESSRTGSSTCMNTCSFPFFMDDMLEDWDKAEGSSPSCLLLDESKRSGGSPMEAVVCASNKTEDVTDVDECFEATALLELEDVMIQLSEKTRICFRDALYRLSKSSQQQHTIYQDRSASLPDWPIFAQVTGESSRMGRTRCVESSTNAIDRTIATLMFSNCGPPHLPFP